MRVLIILLIHTAAFVAGCGSTEHHDSAASNTAKLAVDKTTSKTRGTRVRFAYHDHRVLLPVTLNGKGPYHLIFDTGGSNVMTPQLAAALELATKPAGFAGGAGDGRVPMHATRVDEVKVGNVALRDQAFVVINLDRIRRSFGFAHLDGVIGYELLMKYRATVDYRSQHISFSALTEEARPPRGIAIGFELMRRKPVIAATIAGTQTHVLVDTGDRSSFTLFSKFAQAHNLQGHFAEDIVVSGMGIGGQIPARLGSLDKISLGSASTVALRDVHARLPTTKNDFFARSALAGSIGNGVLRNFVVTFDYHSKTMFLAPQPGDPQPYVFVPPQVVAQAKLAPKQ